VFDRAGRARCGALAFRFVREVETRVGELAVRVDQRALVATIRRRSSMAHSSASSASASRIASAVEVHGNGARRTVNENVNGARRQIFRETRAP
jgi:hypothetical protein